MPTHRPTPTAAPRHLRSTSYVVGQVLGWLLVTAAGLVLLALVAGLVLALLWAGGVL